jgi:hypothetical protein
MWIFISFLLFGVGAFLTGIVIGSAISENRKED